MPNVYDPHELPEDYIRRRDEFLRQKEEEIEAKWEEMMEDERRHKRRDRKLTPRQKKALEEEQEWLEKEARKLREQGWHRGKRGVGRPLPYGDPLTPLDADSLQYLLPGDDILIRTDAGEWITVLFERYDQLTPNDIYISWQDEEGGWGEEHIEDVALPDETDELISLRIRY